MEEDNQPESCEPLDAEFKLKTNNHLELSSISEALESASVEDENAPKDRVDNDNNHSSAFMKTNKSPDVPQNEGSSAKAPEIIRRASVWKLFDPLHSLCQTLNIDGESQRGVSSDTVEKTECSTKSCDAASPKEIIKKAVPNIHDTLISFESPKKLPKPLIPKNLFSDSPESLKKYSEEDFYQILKTQELRFQKEFAKKYSEYEMISTKKDKKLECELSRLVNVNKSYDLLTSRMLMIVDDMSKNNENIEAKLTDMDVEKEKLKADIKTSKEDLCDVESAFSDIHKRYEQSKRMIKSYKENEEHLNKNTESVQLALDEQNSMNYMLESRIHEVNDKAEKEIENTKKLAETQVTILGVQLKKAQVKICTLENDLQQAKSNNGKLGNIYDDLMTKISA